MMMDYYYYYYMYVHVHVHVKLEGSVGDYWHTKTNRGQIHDKKLIEQ